jgi:threonyl-tRNA synthetase
LVTVTDRQNEFADELAEALRRRGLRAHADLRNEKLGFKIREAQQMKVPVIGVIGDRELQERSVAPRLRDGTQLDAMREEAFAQWLEESARPGDGGRP